MNRLLLALLLVFPAFAAADPTRILGVPFGDKLPYSPAVCPFNTENARRICWVGQPFRHSDGSHNGHIHLPDPDSRPAWASYAGFELSMQRDRTITQLKVNTDGIQRSDIYVSISTRFGIPSSQSERSANWSHKDVNIKMLCASKTKCWTTFTTPPNEQDIKLAAERKAREKARPITP